MKLTETRNENMIQITIEGRVDTNTSPELQTAILNAFQKGNKLILDFAQVEYISSAGLRALLIGQKTAMSKGASMKLVNVGDTVMNVLKMSGFSNVLTIE